MEKLYSKEEYFKKAVEANNTGKKLVKVQKEIEYDVEVLEWDYVDRYVDIYDEEGNVTGKELATEIRQVFDEEGNVIGEETVTLQDAVPIMIEEEVEDLETGEKEVVTVQKHHTETRVKTVEDIEIVDVEPEPVDYEKEFFNTSLGYVKRKVTMKDGSTKDFLTDILPLLQVGVEVLTYDIDGTQNKVSVTEVFINECKQQVLLDFYGG